MPKGKIVKNHSVTAQGKLDVDNMALILETIVDGEESQEIYSLEELLSEFDGQFVNLSCKVTENIDKDEDE